MSQVPENNQSEPARFEAASLYVTERPREMMATLTQMEFQVLLDGEPNEAKGGRDLCLGVCTSAGIGAGGLVATIDWGTAFRQGSWTPFLWTGAMICCSIAALAGSIIFSIRYHSTKKNSAYSTLVKRLKDGFPNS
jgi:hypothetical protein